MRSIFFCRMRGANFKVWALNKVCLIITNPDDIGLTLGSPHFRVKSNSYAIPQEGIMGHGLFTIDNMTLWKKNRKLITPAFHFQVRRFITATIKSIICARC